MSTNVEYFLYGKNVAVSYKIVIKVTTLIILRKNSMLRFYEFFFHKLHDINEIAVKLCA